MLDGDILEEMPRREPKDILGNRHIWQSLLEDQRMKALYCAMGHGTSFTHQSYNPNVGKMFTPSVDSIVEKVKEFKPEQSGIWAVDISSKALAMLMGCWIEKRLLEDDYYITPQVEPLYSGAPVWDDGRVVRINRQQMALVDTVGDKTVFPPAMCQEIAHGIHKETNLHVVISDTDSPYKLWQGVPNFTSIRLTPGVSVLGASGDMLDFTFPMVYRLALIAQMNRGSLSNAGGTYFTPFTYFSVADNVYVPGRATDPRGSGFLDPYEEYMALTAIFPEHTAHPDIRLTD